MVGSGATHFEIPSPETWTHGMRVTLSKDGAWRNC